MYGVPFEQFTVSEDVASVLLVVPVVMLLKVMLLALMEHVAKTWILTSKLDVPLAAQRGAVTLQSRAPAIRRHL